MKSEYTISTSSDGLAFLSSRFLFPFARDVAGSRVFLLFVVLDDWAAFERGGIQM
jgi:hypothetical protein